MRQSIMPRMLTMIGSCWVQGEGRLVQREVQPKGGGEDFHDNDDTTLFRPGFEPRAA